MPRARASGGSERMRLDAPRILKAPPRCRFSHLKKTRTPAWASKPAEVMTGVRRASGRMRTAAARTSSAWIARDMNFEDTSGAGNFARSRLSGGPRRVLTGQPFALVALQQLRDRKSTRLNSSHLGISYAA